MRISPDSHGCLHKHDKKMNCNLKNVEKINEKTIETTKTIVL